MRFVKTLFPDKKTFYDSLKNAFLMLHPAIQWKNPVMFLTYICTLLSTFYNLIALHRHQLSWFDLQITLWLWATVFFANFAQSIAESRGKAHAASLKKTKIDAYARQIQNGVEVKTPAELLKKGDILSLIHI